MRPRCSIGASSTPPGSWRWWSTCSRASGSASRTTSSCPRTWTRSAASTRSWPGSSGADMDRSVLALDAARESAEIAEGLRGLVQRDLRRRGVVVALSGGVDSSVCVALAARAFGPERVLVLLLPERESSASSLTLGRAVAEQFGVQALVEDITPALEGLGAYRRRDQAIGKLFPAYGPGWKSKIVIAGGTEGGLNFFKLVVRSPDGEQREE